MRGVQYLTAFNDGIRLEKAELGIVKVDASDGPVNITLPHSAFMGQSLHIIKSDSSSNPVTLDLRTGTYRGSNNNVVLTQAYDSWKVRYVGDEWIDD